MSNEGENEIEVARRALNLEVIKEHGLECEVIGTAFKMLKENETQSAEEAVVMALEEWDL